MRLLRGRFEESESAHVDAFIDTLVFHLGITSVAGAKWDILPMRSVIMMHHSINGFFYSKV